MYIKGKMQHWKDNLVLDKDIETIKFFSSVINGKSSAMCLMKQSKIDSKDKWLLKYALTFRNFKSVQSSGSQPF